MPDLLIELFSEEIPARMQARAADDLRKLVTDGLVTAGLTYGGAAAFATPRRLTLTIAGLTAASSAMREERKGPKVGAPEAAIDGFLRGAGIDRDALQIRDDKKGQTYFAIIEKPGRAAAEIIAEVLDATVRNFPWPKSMRWGNGSLKWVRPLQSIICLLSDEAGAEVVPLTIDGISAGRITYGHRFLSPDAISVNGFDDYEAKLKRAHVILRADERADLIWNDAAQQAFASGLELVEDRALLAEVAGLVEWPVVLMGQIDDAFLGLPPEVLQTSMKEHQKFFSVRNPKTGRIERFVTVANMVTADHGATILAGNQKVLAARLSDAKFFWENDLRVVADAGLVGMGAGLADVTFHNKLGSQADRIARIAALAREIAPHVGADPDLAEQAAIVAKADLQSAMVGEFPELQGLMGRYYAAHAGLDEAVAAACQDHYSPLGPSDAVPTAPVSVAVALADKIDTLCGFWAIDEKPTGSKDPFALRRAALGVIRLVLENGVRVELLAEIRYSLHSLMVSLAEKRRVVKIVTHPDDVDQFVLSPFWSNGFIEFDGRVLVELAFNEGLLAFADAESPNYNDFQLIPAVGDVANDLLCFFHDRLKVYLKTKGFEPDVVDACIGATNADDLLRISKLVPFLQEFLNTDDGENLIQGFKRANNILTQAEAKDGVEYSYGADVKFAEDDAEKALFAALDAADAQIVPAMAAQDFGTAMTAMAALRAPIDAFFTAVQINDDRQVIRRNRLNLLSRIRKICLSVADLTKIEG